MAKGLLRLILLEAGEGCRIIALKWPRRVKSAFSEIWLYVPLFHCRLDELDVGSGGWQEITFGGLWLIFIKMDSKCSVFPKLIRSVLSAMVRNLQG